jgi:flagella basal body P-ring formation protein FlgA
LKIIIYIALSLPLFSQTLKEDIEKYLAAKLPSYTKIELDENSLPQAAESIVLDKTREPIIGKGTALLPVFIKKNSRNTESFISVKLGLFDEALIAKKNIGKKEILDSAFFDKKIINTSNMIGKPCSVDVELKYYRTITYISKGEVLKEEKMEMVPVVNAGDKLTAEIKMNQVVVSIDAVAREKGNVGEVIQIICNNRIFKARIIDSTKVQIE